MADIRSTRKSRAISTPFSSDFKSGDLQKGIDFEAIGIRAVNRRELQITDLACHTYNKVNVALDDDLESNANISSTTPKLLPFFASRTASKPLLDNAAVWPCAQDDRVLSHYVDSEKKCADAGGEKGIDVKERKEGLNLRFHHLQAESAHVDGQTRQQDVLRCWRGASTAVRCPGRKFVPCSNTARKNAMTPTLDANERRSADSEADRMTLWLRCWRRLAPTSSAGTLKCRFCQLSPSKRSSNKVHPVLMVDSPRGRKRRATVGGSSAPEFVMVPEGRPASTVDDIASLDQSVSTRVQGHITPIANLEQAPSPAFQRLSAVIDLADLSVESMRPKGQASSPEPRAPTRLIPAVTISQRATNYPPPPSPTSSLSDQRRKLRSSILLMDRLGVLSTPDDEPRPVHVVCQFRSEY